MKKDLEIDEVTGQVVDAAFKLHTQLGPGLLESVYELVLVREQERRGLRVEKQKAVSFEFDGLQFDDAFRVDLLVEECVVVELKSVETLAPVHSKQLLTYLSAPQPARGTSPQLWCSHNEGRPPQNRKQL